MRVLLIDDSSTMRKIQRRALNSLGIEDIDEAANGKEGVEKLIADGYSYTIVMCDMNMPEMGGLDVLKAVRADLKRHSNHYVHFCSG
jgi:two-component system, chemotaxis family, chemotaxis protein CheY